MNRRDFLAFSAGVPLAIHAPLVSSASSSPMTGSPSSVKLGIDLFSLRGQNWSAFQYLDYCAQRKVQVVHFSEVRFIGGLQPDHLREVRKHAEALGIEVEIGTKSVCPSSKMFDPKDGTADEQLSKMLDAAHIVGSNIVRCVLGSADDRKPTPIEAHIEDMVHVLRAARPKATDLGLKIAVENHAGDMQARELRMLVEEAGPDFVGVCLDSGNPLWTIEDPHLTLDVLHPYVLTSHVRDSAVWRTPEGAAVTWVQMGRGNVAIDEYVRKYVSLCPGKALSLESILLGPRQFPYRQPAFWDAYRKTPAWEFERFVEIAERGHPYRDEAWQTTDEAKRERDALDESLAYTKRVLGVAA
jgi:3-oxoisoapionate decarboxylase